MRGMISRRIIGIAAPELKIASAAIPRRQPRRFGKQTARPRSPDRGRDFFQNAPGGCALNH